MGLVAGNGIGYRIYSRAYTGGPTNFMIAGDIPSGISNLYMIENSNYDLFGTGNYTYVWNRNTTSGHLNMTLAAVRMTVSDLRDPPYTKVVTNNVSVPQFAVPEAVFDTPVARMAQYFEIENLSLIQKVRLYLNTTITGVLTWGHFQLDIYNASDLNGTPLNVNLHTTTLGVGVYLQWVEFSINEYFDSGAYFAVFSSWVTGINPKMNNNSWLVHQYSSPAANKGASFFENTSGWFPIPTDSDADFLMELDLVHYLSPYEVNLSAYLNGAPVELHHSRDERVKAAQLGRPVWQSELLYYLEALPTEDYNVTITINRTIGGRIIVTGGRYVCYEQATGHFIANLSTIQWSVDYRKVNSSSSLLVFFKFPRDWSITKLVSSFGVELVEYGILYSYIYGEYGNAIWIDEGGDGTQTFEYTASFTSPNYLLSGEIIAPHEVYVGDSFRVQAEIRNSQGGLVTGGNCSFYLFNPEGGQIYSTNVTNVNGVVESDELNTNGWAFGTYSMIIVWTNGEEIGITSHTFTLSLSPFILIAVITAAVAISTAVLLTYGRKKLAQRHWEKSLHHLLVISKNGTPMYSYSFGPTIKDTALISGMLSAIASFMKETTGSMKQLKIIDQEDKKIILSYGEQITIAILADKNLPIIHKRAKEFATRFEEQYSQRVSKWTGDTSIFKGANKLVEEYFPVDMNTILTAKAGAQLRQYKELVHSAEDKATLTSILSELTHMIEKYQDIVLKNYGKLVNEIINTAHSKLAEGD